MDSKNSLVAITARLLMNLDDQLNGNLTAAQRLTLYKQLENQLVAKDFGVVPLTNPQLRIYINKSV